MKQEGRYVLQSLTFLLYWDRDCKSDWQSSITASIQSRVVSAVEWLWDDKRREVLQENGWERMREKTAINERHPKRHEVHLVYQQTYSCVPTFITKNGVVVPSVVSSSSSCPSIPWIKQIERHKRQEREKRHSNGIEWLQDCHSSQIGSNSSGKNDRHTRESKEKTLRRTTQEKESLFPFFVM